MQKDDEPQSRSTRKIKIMLVMLFVAVMLYAGWQLILSKVENAISMELASSYGMSPPPDVEIDAFPTVLVTRNIAHITVSADHAVSQGLATEALKIEMKQAHINIDLNAGTANIVSISEGTFSSEVTEASLQHVLPAGAVLDLRKSEAAIKLTALGGFEIKLEPVITETSVGVKPVGALPEAAARYLGSRTNIANGFKLSGNVYAYVENVEIREDRIKVSGTIRGN